MKTYIKNGFKYFYDNSVRLWTIYKIDSEGNQVGDADYCTKAGLKKLYGV